MTGNRRQRAWWKPPVVKVMALAMLIVALVAVLILRKGCAEGVGGLFKAYEAAPDGGGSPAP